MVAEVERAARAGCRPREVAGGGLARPRRGRRRARPGRGDRDRQPLRATSTWRSTRAEDELDAYLDGLRNYGSLFLGEHATVAFGDKAVGTNHVLPTAGAARYTGGLWVGKFLKTLTYQWLTEEGMRQIAPAAAAISEAELFPGHALTARMRLERVGRLNAARTAGWRWSPEPGAGSGAAARWRSPRPGARRGRRSSRTRGR